MKVNIITLGCSKNNVDSEFLAAQLQANGIEAIHESSNKDAGTVIINTCGFIDDAKQESVDTILQWVSARAAGSVKNLVVTGCLSERYGRELKKEIPGVDAWFGTHDMPKLLRYLNASYHSTMPYERQLSTPAHFAYLKVSEGCDRGCSFCAIPIMRGKHVSRPIDHLHHEAKILASGGVRELILIAQDLSSYGTDLCGKKMLPDLLSRLSRVDGIEWIRLHYAYPAQFPMDTLDIMKSTQKLCRYLDMPLQHITDRILKAMHRGISKKRIHHLIDRIRKTVPGIVLRTTFMTGFPGETDDDFMELCRFVEEIRFDRLGVFTYSHEEDTSAFKMEDNIPGKVKKERAGHLMDLQRAISLEKNRALTGQVIKTIIDRREGNFYFGRTEYDSPEVDNEVIISAEKHYLRIGDFANIRIIEAEEFDLIGEPAGAIEPYSGYHAI